MSRTDRASVEFNGRLIEYTIVRSARRKKTIEITLDPERGVLVRSPVRTTRKDIAELVQKRAGWILKHATEDILDPTPRRFTDGERLYYLGEQIPIIADTALDGRVSVSLEDGAFQISTPTGISEEDRAAAVKEVVERWYRREAARLLPEIVARWQSRGEPEEAHTGPDTEPAQALGQLLLRREHPIELAHHNGGTGAHRLRGSPRTRAPRGYGPFAALLEAGRARSSRLPGAAQAAQRGGSALLVLVAGKWVSGRSRFCCPIRSHRKTCATGRRTRRRRRRAQQCGLRA